jgi:hypothetical protein
MKEKEIWLDMKCLSTSPKKIIWARAKFCIFVKSLCVCYIDIYIRLGKEIGADILMLIFWDLLTGMWPYETSGERLNILSRTEDIQERAWYKLRPSCGLHWQFRLSNNHKLHCSYSRVVRERCPALQTLQNTKWPTVALPDLLGCYAEQ